MTEHRDGASPKRADARRNVEAILAAGERCLARDPEASMGDIAREAGLGRVTLYGHFRTRAELVEAVMARVLHAADRALGQVDLGGDAATALARLVEATWQLVVRSGSVLVAAERALPATTVRQAHGGGLEDRVRELIFRGQRSGRFRADLPAAWLVATFHAIVHAAANEIAAGRLDTDRAPRFITATVLGAYAPVAPGGSEPAPPRRRPRTPEPATSDPPKAGPAR